MAEAGKERVVLGLPQGDAEQWPLQRYGRFMLLGAGESPGPGLEAGMASSPTWKVFDSNEESGYLVLTIVISGHFFISQGQTLLEGFSLIGSKNWLKIVRRMDCLLFGTTVKGAKCCHCTKVARKAVNKGMPQDKSRMFRVQFSGESKQQALEHCDSCVQSLAQYVTVQAMEVPLRAADGSGEGCVRSLPQLLRTPQEQQQQQQQQQQWCMPAGTDAPRGRTLVTQLAQALLAPQEQPPAWEQSVWDSEELGPFLRCCLLDRSFPAFVEQVEKELKKLTGLSS